MRTDDIKGAKPKIFVRKDVNRISYVNNNIEIDGSFPRPLHIGLERPSTSLCNRDIQGTKPDCVKFKTTRKPTNPLCPEYKL